MLARSIVRTVLLAGTIALPLAAAAADTEYRYRYVSLDQAVLPDGFAFFSPAAVVNNGKVYGTAFRADDPDGCFPSVAAWQDGRVSILVEGGSAQTANNSGTVAGAVVRDCASRLALFQSSGVKLVPTPPEALFSFFPQLTDSGIALIQSFLLEEFRLRITLSLYRRGDVVPLDLGPGNALHSFVNGSGGIVAGTYIQPGSGSGSDDTRAFRFQTSSGTTTLLQPRPTERISWGQGVNNGGDVLGYSWNLDLVVGVWRNRPGDPFQTYVVENTPALPTISNRLLWNGSGLIVATLARDYNSYIIPRPGVALNVADLTDHLPAGWGIDIGGVTAGATCSASPSIPPPSTPTSSSPKTSCFSAWARVRPLRRRSPSWPRSATRPSRTGCCRCSTRRCSRRTRRGRLRRRLADEMRRAAPFVVPMVKRRNLELWRRSPRQLFVCCPQQHLPHRVRVPSAPPGRWHATCIEPGRRRGVGGRPTRPDRLDHRPEVGRPLRRRGLAHLGAARPAGRPVRQMGRVAAELHAPCLGDRERRLGALGDHPVLVLGHGRQDVDRQPVGLGEVAGDELDPALHQVRDEGDVAGQPVELGDHQGRLLHPAGGERQGELGPVDTPAALDLDELGHEPRGVAGALEDRLPLCLQTEPGSTLALGRDAEIGDEPGRRHGIT